MKAEYAKRVKKNNWKKQTNFKERKKRKFKRMKNKIKNNPNKNFIKKKCSK